jgi:tripartite ATP-independent transporter DctM subunit
MNPVAVGVIIMLIALFVKVPVFVSVLMGSLVYFFFSGSSVPSLIFAQRVVSGIESTTLLAIPFFIASGVFMNNSGVTKRVMKFCSVMTGRMAGGLAEVNVLLSTLMGGLSGSALADAAMEAKMLVPEMRKQGYSNEFSSVVTAMSAMITPLIPPGIGMILYGCVANVSIGKLFVAGIGPGILLCCSMMVLVYFMSKKRGYVPIRTEKLSKQEFWKTIKDAFFPLCLPIIIIGGIRLGVFTPTEAGAVAIVYAMVLGFVYRELTLSGIIQCIKETVITTAGIMLIVGSASALAWVLTKERIPQSLTELIVSTVNNKYVFLFVVNIFLVIVGMFIEGNASMIVLAPLLAPIAAAYGINEIQFAMAFIFNGLLGSLTPPMGTLIFVTCGITGCKIEKFLKEAVPFYILAFACLFLLTYIPIFSTGLVNLLY